MNTLVAGAATGLLLASFLVTFFCTTLYVMYRNRNQFAISLLENKSPSRIIFQFMALVNPTAAAGGIVFAYLFLVLERNFPDNGLASPNLLYTGLVLFISFAMTVPLIFLAKNYWTHLVALATTFALLFGWLIPYLSI